MMKEKRVGVRALAASISVRVMVGVVLGGAALSPDAAVAQSTYTWSPSTPGTSWLNSANWTGGPTNTAPGVDANANSTIDGDAADVATFGTLGFVGNTVGIDFGPSALSGVGVNTGANGLLSLGAIKWNSTTSSVVIGKSDSAVATGVLRLNGATVTPGLAPIANVLAAVGDAATTNLTLGNVVGSGTGTMEVQLGTSAGNFYSATGRTLTINSTITQLAPGSGFNKIGGGTLVLQGSNSFSGPVNVQAGVVSVANGGGLGTSAGGVFVSNNAAVSLRNGVTVSGENISLVGNGGGATAGNTNGALQAASGAFATWAGTVTLDDAAARVGAGFGGTLNITGPILDGLSNTLNIAANSGGTVVLSGANTYTGATNIVRGTLRLGGNNVLPVTTILNVDSSNAAETAFFDLNGYDQTVAGLVRGNPAGGGGSLVVTSTSASSLIVNQSIDTTFSGAITGDITITKTGSGLLELSGANAFTGPTTINGGTLAIGEDSLSATSSLTVNSGGTLLLGGTGDRVSDAAAVTLGGGTLQFGGLSGVSENLGALILTANSVIDFGSGSGNTLRFNSLVLGGNTLAIWNWSGAPYDYGAVDLGTPGSQDRLLFNTPLGLPGLIPQVVFYSDAGVTPLGAGHAIDFGSPVDAIELVPVPEPGTIFGACTLLGLVGWRERRRVRRIC